MTASPGQNRWNDPKWLRKELGRAEAASAKRSAARASLPPGSSRARVTSANAAWARAAEYRDIVGSRLAALEATTEVDDESRIGLRIVSIEADGDDDVVGAALQIAAAAIARGGAA